MTLLPYGAAFVVSLVLAPAIAQASLRRGLLDVPNERSSHVVPTPRLGGLAIACGIGIGLLISGGTVIGPLVAWLLAGVGILAIGGLLDDLRDSPIAVKLGFQFVGSTVMVAGGGIVVQRFSFAGETSHAIPVIVGGLITIIWLVGFANAFNFMDGVNGIASVQAIVSLSAFAIMAVSSGERALAALLVVTVSAVAGFLPWNFPVARIFMGDVGSATLGIISAAVCVALINKGVSVIASVLPLTPFLYDTFLTLLGRIRRRDRVLRAHRSHYYQRLARLGFSHATVTLVWAGLAVLSSLTAVFWDRFQSPIVRWCAFFCVLGVHSLVSLAIIQRERVKCPESAYCELGAGSEGSGSSDRHGS